MQTVRELRRLVEVDLLELVEAENTLIQRLATDAVLLADVIYVVCLGECKRKKISDVEFGRALGGGAIAAATEALLEAIEHFFQSPRQAVIARNLTGNVRLARLMAEVMATANDRPLLEQTLRNGFTATPELSASTPLATA